MVDTVILHSEADANRAHELACAWTSRRALACQIGASDAHLAFGRHVALVGFWSPATGEEGPEAEALFAAVRTHKRRGFLLVCDTRVPPQLAVDAALTIIFTADAPSDLAKLDRIARKASEGCVIASEYVQEEPPPRGPVRSISPRTNRWRRRKETVLAIEQRQNVKPLDYSALRRMSRLGYVVGAILGVVIVIGVLGPWAASLGN
jgi:hypothetical protein